MTRPLMRLGINQLKEMFAQNKLEPKILKQLAEELQYRRTPKAIALMNDVQSALRRSSHAPQSSSVSPTRTIDANPQLQLRPQLISGAPNAFTATVPPATPTRASPASGRSSQSVLPVIPETPSPKPVNMPLEDAYKVLRVTSTSTWDTIELARRQLVQQASPVKTVAMNSEKRSQLQDQAHRANLACLSIWRIRIGYK